MQSIVLRLLLPTGAFICLVGMGLLMRYSRQSRKVAPFPELRRRPAGESIRLRIGELDEKVNGRIAFGAMLFALLVVEAYEKTQLNWFSAMGMALPALLGMAIVAWSARRLIRERDNYQLGFDGERFVGEELSRLIAEGFDVFHDVPFDGFNIDHVLVGPAGVFAVETKTRRKPIDDSGAKQYKVEFDGSCLRWPWGTDTHGIQQAANNARTLSQWLSSAVGDPVQVTPILTLPGWMVEWKTPSAPVQVLNPKQIPALCRTKGTRLSDSLIRRIRYQMEEKCKIAVM